MIFVGVWAGILWGVKSLITGMFFQVLFVRWQEVGREVGVWRVEFGVKERKGLEADLVHRFDPSKFILEHYVDGDLLDNKQPTQESEASLDNLYVWGEFPSGLPQTVVPSNYFLYRSRFAASILDMSMLENGVVLKCISWMGEYVIALVRKFHIVGMGTSTRI
jgi:hypothetical protein